jgi:hypothetical protein
MLRERTIDCSCKRSASLITSALFGLPIPATSTATLTDDVTDVKLFMGHYTSRLLKIGVHDEFLLVV